MAYNSDIALLAFMLHFPLMALGMILLVGGLAFWSFSKAEKENDAAQLGKWCAYAGSAMLIGGAVAAVGLTALLDRALYVVPG